MAYGQMGGSILNGQTNLVESVRSAAMKGAKPVTLYVAGYELGGLKVTKADLAVEQGGFCQVSMTAAPNGATEGFIVTVTGTVPAALIATGDTALEALAEGVTFSVQFMNFPGYELNDAAAVGFNNGKLNLQYSAGAKPQINQDNGSFSATFNVASIDDLEVKAPEASLIKKSK